MSRRIVGASCMSRTQCFVLLSLKLNNTPSPAIALNRKGPAELLRERDYQSKAR
jgi:hypothetical protein